MKLFNFKKSKKVSEEDYKLLQKTKEEIRNNNRKEFYKLMHESARMICKKQLAEFERSSEPKFEIGDKVVFNHFSNFNTPWWGNVSQYSFFKTYEKELEVTEVQMYNSHLLDFLTERYPNQLSFYGELDFEKDTISKDLIFNGMCRFAAEHAREFTPIWVIHTSAPVQYALPEQLFTKVGSDIHRKIKKHEELQAIYNKTSKKLKKIEKELESLAKV